VHGIVPIEPPDGIERAIYVVDTIILNLYRVTILDLIFAHGLIAPRSIDRRISPCLVSPIIEPTMSRRGTAALPQLRRHLVIFVPL
jgi:hypothetical protein